MGKTKSPKSSPRRTKGLKRESKTIQLATKPLHRLVPLPPSPQSPQDKLNSPTPSAFEKSHSSHPPQDGNMQKAASLVVGSITFAVEDGPPISVTVPASSALPSGSFFVRKCYIEFYRRMKMWLNAQCDHGITVTATSGVGTSVFMAYFFMHYQLEHPDNTVVLISFDKESVVQRAVVWTNGKPTALATANIGDVEMQFSEDPDAIFLLDGPPTHRFVMYHRHVVFTSFSEKWIDKITTCRTERTFYMPLWDVDELKTAVDALGLKDALGRMDDVPAFPRSIEGRYNDEITYRFDVFGGVPLPCLETDARVLAILREQLQSAAATVDITSGRVSPHSVDRNEHDQKDFGAKGNGKELHRLLYHWCSSTSRFSYHLKIASPCVAQLLSARLDDLNEEDRLRLEWGANRCPEASALCRATVKSRLLSAIKGGASVVANSLACAAESHQLDLKLNTESSSPVTTVFSRDFGTKDPAGASWYIPQSVAFQSIDALYLISACLFRCKDEGTADKIEIENERASVPWGNRIDAVVFHVMGDEADDIDGKELHELLRQLECMCVHVPRLALVYVVPAAQADYVFRQVIKGATRLNHLFPLTAVTGLSAECSQVLNAANIHTVGDLRRSSVAEALNPDQLQVHREAQTLLHEHENNAVVTGSKNHEKLQQIPQFVWGV